MMPLLEEIERTYVSRCDNRGDFKGFWKDLTEKFPPHISVCSDAPRPSLLLARDAGDLGLAILWIVQTVIVRPMLRDLGINEIFFREEKIAIIENSIGALAHSEDRNCPAIIREGEGESIISGKKKYITGGTYADFLLITARKEGEETSSALILLPKAAIPSDSFREISLPMLRTIEHSSLELRDLAFPRHSLIPIEPAHLRRLLKRWSIMERAFIAEAFTGLCMYIAQKLEGRNLIPENFHFEIKSLLARIQENVTEMLHAALSGQKIPETLPFLEILGCHARLKESIPPAMPLPPEIALRLSDLALFEKMKS